MATIKQNHGTPFQSTAIGTSSASCTFSGQSGKTIFVTDISGSSDLSSATIAVLNGATTVWIDRISNTCAYNHSFVQPLTISLNTTVTVITIGTTVCTANVAGFLISNS